MTRNIYSFSRGRILPQIQAWTDSLHWKPPNPDKLQYKLHIWSWLSPEKNISEVDCCNLSWFCMSLAIFTLMKKLNSATRVGCKHDIQNCHSTLQIVQSSHIHIKIRSWQDKCHGLILQSCKKKGILMCCPDLCMHTQSLIPASVKMIPHFQS